MKYIKFLCIISALCFFVGIPIVSAAQKSDTPWYRNYWGSTISRAVADLSKEVQTDIAVPILYGISPNELGDNFGVPRSGGRTHEGLDILSPRGTPIVSPTRAVVTHIRTGPSAGHSVYTANPGNETFVYLHLDTINPKLKEGDTLQIGDLIGFVGDTGNAKGGPTHLHFEILRGDPVDPFPRITKEFTVEQKMTFTSDIVSNLSVPDQLALQQLVAAEYPDEFMKSSEQNSAPNPPQVMIPTANTETVVEGEDLNIEDEGSAVKALQQHLIVANTGIAARELRAVGATGYFGPLTQRALAEYQQANNIIPANGYYGKQTREFIISNQITNTSQVELKKPKPSQTVFTRNLDVGDRGTDVAQLQEYLISELVGVSARELKDVGATGYFGPLTQRALAEYQRAKNITPAVGYYGPLTRAQMK